MLSTFIWTAERSFVLVTVAGWGLLARPDGSLRQPIAGGRNLPGVHGRRPTNTQPSKTSRLNRLAEKERPEDGIEIILVRSRYWLVFKRAVPGLFFVYFRLYNKHYNFYNKYMWKMSICWDSSLRARTKKSLIFVTFFKKWAIPGLFFIYFRSF